MDRVAIEREARRLQVEIWSRREHKYTLGVPDVPTVFDPRNVADHCGLYYEERERLDTDYRGGGEAAGIWQRNRSTILVSTRYPYVTRRFTAGHEIGHYILHPHLGDRTLHREMAIDGQQTWRPPQEREADYFSACLQMPRFAVQREFEARFGTKCPLVLTEAVAFHLKADQNTLFAQPPGSLMFAQAVARAQQFDRKRFNSLTEYFIVSPVTMAIRLAELGLVAAYLQA